MDDKDDLRMMWKLSLNEKIILDYFKFTRLREKSEDKDKDEDEESDGGVTKFLLNVITNLYKRIERLENENANIKSDLNMKGEEYRPDWCDHCCCCRYCCNKLKKLEDKNDK